MADQYTTSSTTGLGGRMGNSIKGVLFGLIMVVVSFGLLYWNEGRAVRTGNIIKQASQAPVVDATSAVPADPGKLVAANGILATGSTLTDTPNAYGKGATFNPGTEVLSLERRVEMYAWIEEKKTETTGNTGGSETEKTTYTYKKDWTTKPEASSNFQYPEGHLNSALPLDSNTQVATDMTVGSLSLDSSNLRLPDSERVNLTKELVKLNVGTPESVLLNNYLNLPLNSTVGPNVGDVRISYFTVPSGKQAVVFGVVGDSTLDTFVDAKNGTLYRAFFGSKEMAVATMQSENQMLTWILRLVGFLLMWFGLMAVFGPISTFLDILPIAGSISRGLIAGVTFLVALVVSVVVILVGMILHNLIATLVAAVAAIVVTFLVVKGFMRKKTV